MKDVPASQSIHSCEAVFLKRRGMLAVLRQLDKGHQKEPWSCCESLGPWPWLLGNLTGPAE